MQIREFVLTNVQQLAGTVVAAAALRALVRRTFADVERGFGQQTAATLRLRLTVGQTAAVLRLAQTDPDAVRSIAAGQVQRTVLGRGVVQDGCRR